MDKEEQIIRAVWDWIVSVNDGSGLDTGDLIVAMEELGAPCPADLDTEGI